MLGVAALPVALTFFAPASASVRTPRRRRRWQFTFPVALAYQSATLDTTTDAKHNVDAAAESDTAAEHVTAAEHDLRHHLGHKHDEHEHDLGHEQHVDAEHDFNADWVSVSDRVAVHLANDAAGDSSGADKRIVGIHRPGLAGELFSGASPHRIRHHAAPVRPHSAPARWPRRRERLKGQAGRVKPLVLCYDQG
jgi:hypothetical protein